MAMDMKNIWYCIGAPNPHGESHVSEKDGGLDCGGGGTRQQRTRRGTSYHQEAQQDVWNDLVLG